MSFNAREVVIIKVTEVNFKLFPRRFINTRRIPPFSQLKSQLCVTVFKARDTRVIYEYNVPCPGVLFPKLFQHEGLWMRYHWMSAVLSVANTHFQFQNFERTFLRDGQRQMYRRPPRQVAWDRHYRGTVSFLVLHLVLVIIHRLGTITFSTPPLLELPLSLVKSRTWLTVSTREVPQAWTVWRNDVWSASRGVSVRSSAAASICNLVLAAVLY